MKVLVTGASGFTGIHMIGFLSSQEDIAVTGLARKSPAHFSKAQNISWVEGDILSPAKIFDTISSIKPDAIIHLAGLNRGSLKDLQKTNVTGTQNILDATLKINPDCRILAISSGAVYGYAGNTPIAESQILKPLSEYGVSKAAQDTLCQIYHETYGLQVAVARPFNLIGPDQPASLVCGRIIQQIVEIEQGKTEALELLEISSSRDFIDVRDAVKAYWAVLSHPEFARACAGKAFNIGSGKASAVYEVIRLIEKITGEHYRVRLPDVPAPIPLLSQQSDNSRIYAATGWTPRISLQDSLRDMLNAARKNVHIC